MAGLAALTLALSACATGGSRLTSGGPGDIDQARTIASALASATGSRRSLHIVFVHGIRAEGPGESLKFTRRLAREIGAPVPSAPERHDLDLGAWPRDASVSGGDAQGTGRLAIWRTSAEWDRSRPFVLRTSLSSDLGTVIVDEVNYWPLLFPIKCRFLLRPEHDLAGNDVAHLRLCADWLERGELSEILKAKPKSGGGTRINAALKHQIMNWGLADAVIALGPMRRYLNDAMDLAFRHALGASQAQQDYLVVAESLGSFVVLDAYAENAPGVVTILDRTADLYFLANQFALLDLARIQGIPTPTAGTARFGDPAGAPSILGALQRWAGSGNETAFDDQGLGQPRQIIAFSDPSDLLTYRVPQLPGVNVVNVYDVNGRRFLGLFENPVQAHTGHVDNDAVWRLLMEPRRGRAARRSTK